MSKNSNKIVFASNYLLQASKMLEEDFPDISDTVLLLANTIFNELPEEEQEQINIAMMDIELKREEVHGRC
jgi:hypothetical protein